MALRLTELAQCCDAKLIGDETLLIDGVANLNNADVRKLSLFTDRRYLHALSNTRAAAVLTTPGLAEAFTGNQLVVDNPLLALAKILNKFEENTDHPNRHGKISENAEIAISAQLGEGVSIGANVVIGDNVVLGDQVSIGAGAVIHQGVTIAEGSTIDSNVTLYRACRLGQRCHVSAGTVIGADGFGFAETRDDQGMVWVAIPQTARVWIGNDVHIGANTTIDRGSLEDTVIADGVIIDNLVQIAHNVKIGRHTAIAGCAAIAGSTQIGENCKIGGRASIVGHIKLCDDVTIFASSLVTKSITRAGVYSSSMPAMPAAKWRKLLARFRLNAHK